MERNFFRDVDGTTTYLGNRYAQDINNGGRIAGNGLWTKGTGWSDLPGTAYDINDLGQVAGSVVSTQRAFVWSQTGGTTDLATLLPNAWSSSAGGINGLGHVVGGWYDISSNSHAFFWSISTGIIDLPGLTEDGYAFANGINDYGQIVGQSNGHAVLWTPVPEPSSILALLGGMIGLGGFVLRKKKA